jgi:hypothetical protein
MVPRSDLWKKYPTTRANSYVSDETGVTLSRVAKTGGVIPGELEAFHPLLRPGCNLRELQVLLLPPLPPPPAILLLGH